MRTLLRDADGVVISLPNKVRRRASFFDAGRV
jgi:hypothetical protein